MISERACNFRRISLSKRDVAIQIIGPMTGAASVALGTQGAPQACQYGVGGFSRVRERLERIQVDEPRQVAPPVVENCAGPFGRARADAARRTSAFPWEFSSATGGRSENRVGMCLFMGRSFAP